MKKLLAAMLAAVMLLSMGLSASAASGGDALDSRLAAVTLKVKEKLNIGDDYTDFYGDLESEGSRPIWRLNWYMEDNELSVSAGEDGTVYSLSFYDYNETGYYDAGYAPHFPRLSRAEAQKELEKLIAPLLGKNESVRFTEREDNARDADSYYFYGTLCVNSVPTIFSVRASLRLSDLRLTSYNRSDSYTVVKGGYPSASPKISQADALELFRGVYTSKLEYACYDGKNARLVYLFSKDDDYLVNAATGKLFKRSELYAGRGDSFSGAAENSSADAAEAPEAESNKAALTDTELKGIAKLEGALSADKLDGIIRSDKLLGVTNGYELKRVDYSLDTETDEITAYVSYSIALTSSDCASVGLSVSDYNKLTEEGYRPGAYKNYTIHGKTGELMSGYTNYRGMGYDYEAKEKPVAELSEAVKAWLGAKYANFSETKLYNSNYTDYSVERDSYTFAQHVNGYFFPENQISLSVNRASGCIDDFGFFWNDEVSFETPADTLISAEKALDVYMASFNELLKYELDRSENISGEYIWPEEGKAVLTWQLEADGCVHGVYAADGSLAAAEKSVAGSEKFTYSDLGSEPERAKIEKLAQYGIGFPGGEFKAAQKLTEKEMLAFFLSATGNTFPEELDKDDLDTLYTMARSYGLYDGQRHPDRAVTRVDAVRSLVSALGYSEIASLSGIYAVPFSDAGEIGEANLGYVALAKGLGIISGDAKGTFRPNSALSRKEAAVMLYNLMSR
jgi:hypothetical protein